MIYKNRHTILGVIGLVTVLITASMLDNRNKATDLAPITTVNQSTPAPLSNVNPSNATNSFHTTQPLTPKTISTVKPKANRTLTLYGEVGANALDLAEDIKNLGQQNKEPIYLLINSPGGSVFDGALVISAIEASPAPVYTVCLQICASMAAIIHQYGHKRMMVDRSILMFHDAAGGLQGYVHHMVSRLNQIHSYIHKMDKYISQRAGIDFERYLQEANRELWVDSEDATNLKLNDSIVNVVLPKNEQELKLQRMTDKVKSFNIVWE